MIAIFLVGQHVPERFAYVTEKKQVFPLREEPLIRQFIEPVRNMSEEIEHQNEEGRTK